MEPAWKKFQEFQLETAEAKLCIPVSDHECAFSFCASWGPKHRPQGQPSEGNS